MSNDPFDPVGQQGESEAAAAKVTKSVNDAVALLLRRKEAYTRVFNGAGSPDDNKLVLDDLTRFCRGDRTTFDTSPAIHALLTGRQEVFFRIRDFTQLSLDELTQRYIQS